MMNGRRRAKYERRWKELFKEAKERDEIRAIEKTKQMNKCNNFETSRTDGYSIDEHKTALGTQVKNFAEIKAQSERYNAAPKLSCKRANMTLPNGERITGVWRIVSAYDILPSHNPETFADSKNFPMNKDGKNVNDRNYATDRMAQSFVKSVAQRFDGRAIEEPIRISKDGIVVDGNNRTMSRIVAHKQHTDLAYIEALHDLASEKCMCHDDIAQIEAPTMVFEIDSEPNYSRQYFALFNANTKKEKTAVDTVITLASTVSQRVRNIINSEFDKYEDLSKLYASKTSVQAIRNALIDDGVIMESEFNKYFDQKLGNFTDDGKKILQRIVLSGVLSDDNVRVLDMDGLKNINEKILYSIVPVTLNQAMKPDFALKSELNGAIDILYAANMSNMSVADSISQSSMFSENEVKTDYESLAVAIFLSKTKAQFKKIIGIYNTAAKGAQGGSLFGEAEKRDKRQILKDTIDWMQEAKMLTDGDKYALQRYEKIVSKPKTVVDMLPSKRKKLSEAETQFLTQQVKKETVKQAKPTPSVFIKNEPKILSEKELKAFDKKIQEGLVLDIFGYRSLDLAKFEGTVMLKKFDYKKDDFIMSNLSHRFHQSQPFILLDLSTNKEFKGAVIETHERILEMARVGYFKPHSVTPPSVQKPKNDLSQYTKGKYFYNEVRQLYYKVRDVDSEKIHFDIYEFRQGELNKVNTESIFKDANAPIFSSILQPIDEPKKKALTLINDLKQALKYIKDATKKAKYTKLIAELELAVK